jgi:hypothetical protein
VDLVLFLSHLLNIAFSRSGQPSQLSIIFWKDPGRLNHSIETKFRNPFGIADISLSSWRVLNFVGIRHDQVNLSL